MGQLPEIIDFGIKDYNDILKLQQKLFFDLLEHNSVNNSKSYEYLLLGEHFPVITCGKHANKENILLTTEILNSKNISVVEIERGGDVTYHAPGQLIAYPIIDMKKYALTVKQYVNLLEESVIRLIANYGIKGERIEGATGVWVDKGNDKERKICAIGIKCRKFCTMHGLALNVTTDLSGFSMINPCGFIEKGVTSMATELGYKPEMNKIKKEFSDIFFSLIFSF